MLDHRNFQYFMRLNFVEIIADRQNILEMRIKRLEEITANLKVSKGIEFSICDIPESVNTRKKGGKVGIEQLNFLENEKGPFVYFFEISFCESRKTLTEKIKLFRSRDNKDADGNDLRRSTAAVPINVDENKSTILYVGSIKEYIHTRIRQHLGCGHKDTYAIQLRHWAPKSLKLKFYYISVTDKDLTHDIEAAVAKKLKPLIGKIEK
jgi:hypothetical protein